MSDLRIVVAIKPDPRIHYMKRLQGPWGTYVAHTRPDKDGFTWPHIADYGNGSKPNWFWRRVLIARLRWLDR